MGVVSLSVTVNNLSSYIKAKEGEGENEYIIVRDDKYLPPIYFILFYGKNKSRFSKESMVEEWQ